MNDNNPLHDGNLHSFADSFHLPPNNNNNAAAPPPSKKAKRRRKRHAPPGPAGVWFQSQLVNNTTDSSSPSTTNKHSEDAMAAPDVSSCPAWMCMQASLNLVTPYLPRHFTMQQRFQQLRPILPQDYILLPEILTKTNPLFPGNKKLLVLVHAAAVQYHSYWTMELRDECGASIKGWMDPCVDETELLGILQMGVVWLLRDFVVYVDSATQQTWLLLTKKSIERAWTPLQASQQFSDAHYIEWMTKRSLLTTTTNELNHEMASGATEEEEEQEQVIDVDIHTTHTHAQDNNHEEEEEENEIAILPRNNFSAARRSVVTPRFATTSSTAPPTRQPSNNNNNNAVTAERLQEVVDTPHVANNDDARRVSMSQPQPQAPFVGGSLTNPQVTAQIPPSILANGPSTNSHSSPPLVSNPYANKARNAQQQGAITARQPTTTTTTSALTASRQSQPDSGSLSQNSALPSTKNSSHEATTTSDFSQFRSPTASNDASQSRSRTFSSNTQVNRHSTTEAMAKQNKSTITERKSENDTTSESRPLQTTKNAVTVPNSHSHTPNSQSSSVKSTFQSSLLMQFAAGSSYQQQESPNLSQGNSSTEPSRKLTSSQKSPLPTKKSKKKRTKLQETPLSKSPNNKEPSNLWLGADASMMAMLNDDDDNEENGDENQINSRKETIAATKEVSDKESIPQEQSTLASSSLFQASAFAGMMDNLFDEDE